MPRVNDHQTTQLQKNLHSHLLTQFTINNKLVLGKRESNAHLHIFQGNKFSIQSLDNEDNSLNYL